MNIFRNDYCDLCHPVVLKAINDARDEENPGYCYDSHCENAKKLICAKLGAQKDVFFVQGGTAANVLALTFNLKPHQAIISPVSGHIVNDEVGAIEANAHKVVTIPTEDGKLDPKLLKEKLESFGDFHNVLPGIVYISNATETGRVYKKDELLTLYNICKSHDVMLYIDGARMSAALGSDFSDLLFSDMTDVCDVFSIGGTKNGALFGEALVFNDESHAKEFNYFMKQRSSLLSKGFLLGIQFETLFRDDIYFENGKIASQKGKMLANAFKEASAEFAEIPESNQIFVYLTKEEDELLSKSNIYEIYGEVDGKLYARFTTTYKTSDDEINSLINDFKKL